MSATFSAKGYVPQAQNMFAAIEDNTVTMATEGTTMTLNVAVMITDITLVTAAQTTAIPDSITNSINHLSTNQTAIMNQISQIAAMPLNQQVSILAFQMTQAPPIQQLIISTLQPFISAATGGFQAGTGC
jgi:hypothetical protein